MNTALTNAARVAARFDALGEPTRRLILEALADGELSAGDVVKAVQAGGSISQPAVSQHLKILRGAGLVTMQADGTRRVYAIDPDGISAALAWLSSVHDPIGSLAQPLDALETEVARGKRQKTTVKKSDGKHRRSRSA